MKKITLFLVASLALAALTLPPRALAQEGNKEKEARVSLDLKDAPARSAFETLFKSAKIKNYVIDNTVAGLVTISLEDQPVDSAIRYMLLANTMPLTMIKDNNVYIIKRRVADQAPAGSAAPPPSSPLPTPKPDAHSSNSTTWEKIPLNFIDPLDLQLLFGPILNFQQFSRFRGGQGGFGGGMMGGTMGGMMGSGGVGGGPGARN